jgi:hypothetical protein
MRAVVLFSSALLFAVAASVTSPALAQPAVGDPSFEGHEARPAEAPATEPLPPAPVAAPAEASPARRAPAPTTATPKEEAQPEGPPRYDLIRINVGARVGYIRDAGFDPFASNDVLSQFSIDGTVPVLHRGKLVLAAGLGWDVGGRSDKVRGFDSSLTAHRVSVPIEARWHFKPWLYGFGKIAPGAVAMLAEIKDGSSTGSLSASPWAFSGDASLGASLLMGPRAHLDRRGAVRFWLTPEIGYSVTTKASFAPNPGREDKDILGSDENTKLHSLALSGMFWRASIATTF